MHSSYFTSFLLLALLTVACSKNQRTETKSAESPIVASKPSPIKYISPNSLRQYISDCQAIRSNRKARRPFNNLKYDKVIAYNYDGGEESPIDIVQQGRLAPTIKQQRSLSQLQVNKVTALLGAPETYGEAPTFCFIPHFGLVFFKGTTVKASISICLSCNRLSSSINIPATQAHQIKIDEENTYPAEGFSKPGREKLTTLVNELGFSGN